MKSEYRDAIFTGALPAGGFPKRFAIVTACNPNGVGQTAKFNHEMTVRLRIHLESLGLVFFPIVGGSRDGAHSEASFGIEMETGSLGLEIGRKFNQDAIFWVEGGNVFLLSCKAETLTELGTWDDRWLGK